MRLVSAEIRGFGRLLGTKVNLDTKLVAVVGPNEAGKSTFLEALAYVDGDQALSAARRSRAEQIPDSTDVVTVSYVLDKTDVAAVEEYELAEKPARLQVSRKASGGAVELEVFPRPRKSVTEVEAASEAIESILATVGNFDEILLQDTVFYDHDSDAPRDFVKELAELRDEVAARVGGGSGALPEDAAIARASELLQALDPEETEGSDLGDAIELLRGWLSKPDPALPVGQILWRRSPDFLLFSEADRTLLSSYNLDDQLRDDPPPAISNLARLAELDLRELVQHHQQGDISRRDTVIIRANKRLQEVFADAWKQSRLTASLTIDGSLLRVNVIEDGVNLTVFDERSAGMKMYVALLAFLAKAGRHVPPVLLIDEAENHLHLDAQADLVSMFVSQDQAAKVIYTTHSPACLPPDLGVGIRSVVPRPGNDQVSDLENSFWTKGAGFSPLMLAMGAAAAAFTPARYVLLTEGASDMLLLPSLFRDATGRSALDLQVAPGLSEVPRDFYPQLDLEAARVAYLVDNDQGGARLTAALTDGGVPKDRLFVLATPGVENLLDPNAYTEVAHQLIRECNPGKHVPDLPIMGAPGEVSWSREMARWCDGEGLTPPSKVAVASRIIDTGRARVAEMFASEVAELHDRVLSVLRPRR